MSIDATLAGTVLLRFIPNLEILLKYETTNGKSIVAGYVSASDSCLKLIFAMEMLVKSHCFHG